MRKSDSNNKIERKTNASDDEETRKQESEESRPRKGATYYFRLLLQKIVLSFVFAVLFFLAFQEEILNFLPSRAPSASTSDSPKEPFSKAKGLFSPDFPETVVETPNLNANGEPERREQSESKIPRPVPMAFAADIPQEIQVIRIATWNLYPFDFNKLTDAQKSSKIVRLFLEFDVIAVQGIRSKNQSILDGIVYLLKQQGANYGYACSSTASQTSEFSTFFFNLDRVQIDRETLVDLADSQGRLSYPALTASFRPVVSDESRAFTFTLINVWIDPNRPPQDRDALLDVYQTVRKTSGKFGVSEDDVIMLGSFNASIRDVGALTRAANLVAVHFDKATGVDGTSFENICFSEKATIEYIERYGVVNLCDFFDISPEDERAISESRPVWADFSVYEGGL